MPEEINRVLTDRLSDLLLTPSADGDENLKREGVDPVRIHMVGNIMIDSLVRLLPKAQALAADMRCSLGVETGRYVLATLHRPANVDEPEKLAEILAALEQLAASHTVILPVHPRTRQRIDAMGFKPAANLKLIAPLGYLDFLALQQTAALVVTDSGGVQEETTFLGIPCLTVRPNTERPVTVTHGTNELVACDRRALTAASSRKLAQTGKTPPPPLWDGATGERVADLLETLP
jgi:UDP-N-acetylglucosamine 2-epimerase (non-hydrolysing)